MGIENEKERTSSMLDCKHNSCLVNGPKVAKFLGNPGYLQSTNDIPMVSYQLHLNVERNVILERWI